MTFDRAYYEAQGRDQPGILCSEPTITAAVIEMARGYLTGARHIADVGCGANLDYDRFLTELGKQPIAIDFCMSFLKLAPRIEGVSLAQGDCTALPVRTASLDAVICSECVEHVPSDHLAVQEIARVLKTGGTLILTVPNLWNAFRLIEMAKMRSVPLMPTHLREYSPRLLRALLSPYFSILRWGIPFPSVGPAL